MSEHAENLLPEAEEAVRAYIRMNRARLAADGSLLAMLLPERFAGEVHDLQRHVIEKLQRENAALKAKLEAVERAVKSWGSPPKL
jgi:pyrroloquinoline quinone (PQQ) biosynthesis protein C